MTKQDLGWQCVTKLGVCETKLTWTDWMFPPYVRVKNRSTISKIHVLGHTQLHTTWPIMYTST